MTFTKKLLASRGIQITEDEEKHVNGFYESLQLLKLDYDERNDNTKEILLTLNIGGGKE